jgi:RNA polymerase sigma-70 factor, ECF subfamily
MTRRSAPCIKTVPTGLPSKHQAQVIEMNALEAHSTRDHCSGTARSGLSRPASLDQSVRELIVALIPRLQRYARVLTRDAVAAEDLVQDCLSRALAKSHLWQPGTDLRAWLFTILHNQHINQMRREARQREGIELQASDAHLVLPPTQTARLELRDVERGLARLPDEQRSVVLLIGLKGMGYDEAALVANTPTGTVRSRVARGRQTLRDMTGLFPARHTRRSRQTPPVPSPAIPGSPGSPGSSPGPGKSRVGRGSFPRRGCRRHLRLVTNLSASAPTS